MLARVTTEKEISREEALGLIQHIRAELMRRKLGADAELDHIVDAITAPDTAPTDVLRDYVDYLERVFDRTEQENAAKAAKDAARWTMIAAIATVFATTAALITAALALRAL